MSQGILKNKIRMEHTFMGLKFERTNDLEKLFESFATEPEKLNTDPEKTKKPKQSNEQKKK